MPVNHERDRKPGESQIGPGFVFMHILKGRRRMEESVQERTMVVINQEYSNALARLGDIDYLSTIALPDEREKLHSKVSHLKKEATALQKKEQAKKAKEEADKAEMEAKASANVDKSVSDVEKID